MKFKLIFGLMLLLLASCAGTPQKKTDVQETTDPNVKLQLQGVWMDRNTESPVLEIEGDSLLFASKRDIRMPYVVVDDTLFVKGISTAAYEILEQSEFALSIRTPMGDEVCLYKNEQGDLSLESTAYSRAKQVKEVIKKDSVIMIGKHRYRGYVTINPTSIKVVSPGVTEDGFAIDNVYYDNIIHICVYEGKQELCGKDIKRTMFEGIVPAEFLSASILQDMNFSGVVDDRFLFNALLCVPDGPCYYVRVFIDKANEVEVSFME